MNEVTPFLFFRADRFNSSLSGSLNKDLLANNLLKIHFT